MPVSDKEKRPGQRPWHVIVVLLVLTLLQVLYLARHADWVLAHPVQGAHWEELANHGREWPSDYLPGGYFMQNRDAMLMFLVGLVLMPWLLKRCGLLRFQGVVFSMVLCLLAYFAVAILFSEQRYFWSIKDRHRESAELVEIIRMPMTHVPKGHCQERIGLRLQAESGIWLMHLKCDTSLAYAISQQPPIPGARFQMETGRDMRGNRVLLALEPSWRTQ